MKKNTSRTKTRGDRGKGRLYIRTADKKEHPAASNVKGVYWLEFRIPTSEIDSKTGKPKLKRKRQKLTHDDGQPITKHSDALKAQEQIIAQYVMGQTKDRLIRLQAEIDAVELERATVEEQSNPPLKISDSWDAYLNSNDAPETGEDTLKYYAGYWKKCRLWLKAEHPETNYLRDITSQMANGYASKLNRSKISPNTFNKHIGFLKLFFRVLEEPARLKENPFEKIKKKKLKTNVRRELKIEELKTILDNASGELKTLLCLGTFTGLRLGDCCTLRWAEVDMDRRQIRRIPNKLSHNDNARPVVIGIPIALYQNLAETSVRKRKGYVVPEFADLYTYRNESGRPTRQPEIAKIVQNHFIDYGIQTHKEGTGYKLEPDPNRPGKFIKTHTGKRAVVEVGFHSLRHTFVSLQAERGTPQSTVQAIVGHGSPAMTQHYTHITNEAAQQAAKALDSGIIDAEYEIVKEVPDWIRKELEKMTAKNWKTVRDKLLKSKK